MKTTVSMITSAEEMKSIKGELTSFLNIYSPTPFLLYPFIEQLIQEPLADSTPLFLVVRNDDEIIGFAPLLMKQRFGIRSVTSFLKPSGSPDIVTKEGFRAKVLRNMLFVLQKRMNCKTVTLTLPAESENLEALEIECKRSQIHFLKSTNQSMNHGVIPVNCSWNDYQKTITKKQRKKLKATENHLSSLGEWKIKIIETSDDDQSADKIPSKIHAIEKASWKDSWRSEAGLKEDRDLERIWKTSRVFSRTNPDLKTMVWMLELRNEPVAYALVWCYGGTAIIAKSSFAHKLGKLSPGVYIINSAIKGLFDYPGIQKIDFLTDLPVIQTWHTVSFSRVNFHILAKNLDSVYFAVKNPQVRKNIGKIFYLPFSWKNVKTIGGWV